MGERSAENTLFCSHTNPAQQILIYCPVFWQAKNEEISEKEKIRNLNNQEKRGIQNAVSRVINRDLKEQLKQSKTTEPKLFRSVGSVILFLLLYQQSLHSFRNHFTICLTSQFLGSHSHYLTHISRPFGTYTS